MPTRKRKQAKAKKPVQPHKQAAQQQSMQQAAAASSMARESQESQLLMAEETKKQSLLDFDSEEFSALSTHDLKAMYNSMQFSSVGELHSHMQNTISQMRGDKTVTDTTASVSIEGGGIGLQRNLRADEDELGLSQLASAVNQISAVQREQMSVLTGQESSRMMWLEDEMAAEGAQFLQKTQIYESVPASVVKNCGHPSAHGHSAGQNAQMFDANSALPYEKLGYAQHSRDSTFIRKAEQEDGGASSLDQTQQEQMILKPGLLQQLMLNSEQFLNQKIGNKHKEFAPFAFTESILEEGGVAGVSGLESKVDHIIGAQFDEPGSEDKGSEPVPVLGLNLKEYFQRRHLVDQVPVEPLPPIENPLEMTQNHANWVRGQEDFKINHEQLQTLAKPGKDIDRSDGSVKHCNNIFSSELMGDAFGAHEIKQEMQVLRDNIRSVSNSFETKSWETLTQKHRNSMAAAADRKIEEAHAQGFSMTHRDDDFNRLLENIDTSKDSSMSHVLSQKSKAFQEESQNQIGNRLLTEMVERNTKEKQAQLTQTFVENFKPHKLERLESAEILQSEAQKMRAGSLKSEQNESLLQAQESRISGVAYREKDDNSLEAFISHNELQQLLQLESSLFNLLQETSITDFMMPNRHEDGAAEFRDEDYESFLEPQAPQIGGSLKNLENYLIKGDLRNCVLCNTKYSEPDPAAGIAGNLPRVLFCGDSLCESCITKQIQRASITEKSNMNTAACQVVCPVCDEKHIFKLTKTGFLVCNDKYIKVQDEKGPVNFFPSSKINLNTFQLDKDLQELNLMDNSVSIPNSLIIRSLPVNVELLDLLKTSRRVMNPSQIEGISAISESPVRVNTTPRKPSNECTMNLTGQAKPVVTGELDQHMSAFNVEEFVREYEQDILDRLSNQYESSAKSQDRTDPKQTLKALGEKKRAMQEQAAVIQATPEKNDSLWTQSEEHKRLMKANVIYSQDDHWKQVEDWDASQQTTLQLNARSNRHKRLVADLQERFEGKRETSQEERARRARKEPPPRKKPNFPGTFKTHNAHSGAGSSLTMTAGSNTSAHAILKRKRLKKAHQVQRRDSSYSSSSDDMLDRMRSLGLSRIPYFSGSHKAIPIGGTKAALSYQSQIGNGLQTAFGELASSDLKQDAAAKRTVHQDVARANSMEKLVPLDLEVEQLGFSHPQKKIQYDQLSDGSDLSPEELLSENSLKMVSMEMMHHASQQLAANAFAATPLSANLGESQEDDTTKFFSSNMLVKDANGEVHLQPLPPETLIERKKQMRLVQEERRREKKQKELQLQAQQQQIQQDEVFQKIRHSAEILVEQQFALDNDERMAREVNQEIAAAIKSAASEADAKARARMGEQFLGNEERQSKQQPSPMEGFNTLQQNFEDSASKKKARRNKKKRRKQHQTQQAQHLAELMNGHKLSEENETDMFTTLVPVEEAELHPDPDSKHGDVKFRYVLATRDYFDSEQLFEGDIAAITRANQLTSEAPEWLVPDEQNRVSICCSSCSAKSSCLESLWFRCDMKTSTNANFQVQLGQTAGGNAFQFSKNQLNVLKELIELGMTNLPSHYCEECNEKSQDQASATGVQKYFDVAKLCFICSLEHRLEHPDHTLQMILPMQILQQQLKRSERMELMAREKIALLQEQKTRLFMVNLVPILQDLVLDKSKDIGVPEAAPATNNAVSKKSKPAKKNNVTK